jgi:YidC/Oxa1 family membrane protein insertase
MDEPKSSFFDSRTMLALGLMIVVWMGWQKYLSEKYPSLPTAADKPAAVSKAETPVKVEKVEAAPTNKNDEIGSAQAQPEVVWLVDNAAWSFKISSRGMGLKDISLRNFTDRAKHPIRFGGELNGHLPLETNLLKQSQPLNFSVEKKSDVLYIGHAKSQGFEITKSLTLDPEKYAIETVIQVVGPEDALPGLVTYIVEPLHPLGETSFFSPVTEHQEAFVQGPDESQRLKMDMNPQELKVGRAQTVALATQYFAQALVDRSDVMPGFSMQAQPTTKSIIARVEHQALTRGRDFSVRYGAFLGPKSLSLLKQVDGKLASVVDFGFFSMLGRPILEMLKAFHVVFGNWGVAIIVLTILVRVLVLPFNIMAFRSSRAMQAIQPKIQALKLKYKEDPTRLNQETMLLFKTNKVNPLGGCLPVLLQIPVFFALYQVLGQSVELYQAPFVGWIQDLSFKDPYFVLPILMSITMFFQQKLTPTAMDPAQAKVLMFMPVIFGFFMLTLPSGLTLYIFVSALFGILQQLYLMKGTKPVIATNV